MALNGRLSVSVKTGKGTQLVLNNIYCTLFCKEYKCILMVPVFLGFFHEWSLSFIIENKGELTFSLKKTAALAPFAQVVIYTVLPSGEAVADSMNFPTEECLPNKVRKSHMKSHFRIQCALQAFMYLFFIIMNV